MEISKYYTQFLSFFHLFLWSYISRRADFLFFFLVVVAVFYSGQVKTIAGNGREGFKDGIGSEARFNYPEGVAFDLDNKVLYVVEFVSYEA